MYLKHHLSFLLPLCLTVSGTEDPAQNPSQFSRFYNLLLLIVICIISVGKKLDLFVLTRSNCDIGNLYQTFIYLKIQMSGERFQAVAH